MILEKILKNLSFKKKFYELCQENGVEIKEVAEKTQIGLQTLYKGCELDVFPTLPILIKLCEYFNCSIDYILGQSDEYGKFGNYSAENFIKNYENLLQTHGTTHYQVAKTLKIGRNRLYDWESGQLPYAETLIILANYFDIEVSDLLE